MTERFTEQWHEIRRHVTIEKDVMKLAILAEDKRKRQEAIVQRKS